MPAYLERQSQIRQMPWGRTYLWDMRFEEAPAPFRAWFPASDVDENVATLNTKTIEGGISTYEVPMGSSAFDLNITFYDDENHTLLDWITEWVNLLILDGEKTIAVLDQAVKRVDLVKMNSRREEVKTSSYLVFPKGGINFRGTADAAIPQYAVPFAIAGT